MAGFTADQLAALSLPLPATDVREVDGNPYVPGWRIIDKLNTVFGHDGWSSTTLETQQLGSFQEERQGRNGGAYTLHKAVFRARVRLTVFGHDRDVHREDEGAASGVGTDPVRAIETALMSANTTALKRAARQFGHPFGLALYDEDRRHVGAGNSLQVDAIAADVRRVFEAAMTAAQLNEALRTHRDRVDLLPEGAQKEELRDLIRRKQSELAQARKAGGSRADALAGAGSSGANNAGRAGNSSGTKGGQ